MNLKKWFELKIPGVDVSRMNRIKMPPLKIGDSSARVPIIQGGMGVGISLSRLASAVANEGGIGVIAANAIGMIEPDYYSNGKAANQRALRKEIQKARKMSDGIIGVNIMVAVNDFHDLLRVSIEEKVDMVFLGAGLPLKGIPVQDLAAAGVKVVPIVSSARAANLIFRYWQKNYSTIPDAVVVEGPKAGGHLGFKEAEIHDPGFALEKILPAVVEELRPFSKQFAKPVPVIAAGGIFDGEDIYKSLKLGASGVQMATRFVGTHECDADKGFKKAYLDCKEKDIVIIKSPVGLLGRAIKNSFLENIDSAEPAPVRCPWRCLESCNAKKAKYCISSALDNARQGNLNRGFAFAGANAFRVKNIIPVKVLLKTLKKEYVNIAVMDTSNIRDELEETVKKLCSLRDQYVKNVKKNVSALKQEIGEIWGKKVSTFSDEHKHAAVVLEHFKNEYHHHFNRINDLKEQLSRFFDPSSLNLPNVTGLYR